MLWRIVAIFILSRHGISLLKNKLRRWKLFTFTHPNKFIANSEPEQLLDVIVKEFCCVAHWLLLASYKIIIDCFRRDIRHTCVCSRLECSLSAAHSVIKCLVSVWRSLHSNRRTKFEALRSKLCPLCDGHPNSIHGKMWLLIFFFEWPTFHWTVSSAPSHYRILYNMLYTYSLSTEVVEESYLKMVRIKLNGWNKTIKLLFQFWGVWREIRQPNSDRIWLIQVYHYFLSPRLRCKVQCNQFVNKTLT